MPSSISNSSFDRIPVDDWNKVWLLTIILLIPFFAMWNIYWFEQREFVSGSTSAEIWVYQRSRIEPFNPKTIALLGSSRSKAGIDLKTLTQQTGYDVFQLGVGGTSPFPLLKHFAEDKTFNGVLIIETSEVLLFENEIYNQNPSRITNIQEWIKRFEERSFKDSFEFRLGLIADKIFVSPKLGSNLPDKIYNLLNSRSPNNKRRLRLDRSRRHYRSLAKNKQIAHRRKSNFERMDRLKNIKSSDYKKYLQFLNRNKKFVEDIQNRGGKVVFVKFPICGKLKKVDKEIFPREIYWNELAKQTSGKTIHFEDYPSLTNFRCIDDSHLLADDMSKFTKELSEIVSKKLKLR